MIILNEASIMKMSTNRILERVQYRDLVAQYGAAATVAAISFLMSAAVARRIGPEQFGVYATALAVGAVLGIFIDFGFSQIVQREAARATLPISFRQLQGVAVANSLIVATLFVAGAVLLFSEQLVLAGCIAGCFAGAAHTKIISAGLRGQGRFVKDAWHQIASRCISALCMIGALLFAPDVATILGAWGIGLLAWAIFAFTSFSKPSRAPLSAASHRHAWPLFIIDLMIVLHFRMDLLLMQHFSVDPAFIGNFSASLRVVELFIFLTFPVRSILLTRIRQEPAQSAGRNLITRCAAAIFIALLISISATVLAPVLIAIIYGAAFEQATGILRVMIWLLLPSFSLAIVFETAVARNIEKTYRTAALLVLVANAASLTAVIHYGNDTLLVVLKVGMEVAFASLAFLLVYDRLKRKD